GPRSRLPSRSFALSIYGSDSHGVARRPAPRHPVVSMRELRAACEAIAERARHVRVERDQIPLYAVSLTIPPRLSAANAPGTSASIDAERPTGADRERLAAFWLTLDAINFGSGWFPTLRKRQGRSGYYTIATGLRERFEEHGPWSAAELT